MIGNSRLTVNFIILVLSLSHCVELDAIQICGGDYADASDCNVVNSVELAFAIIVGLILPFIIIAGCLAFKSFRAHESICSGASDTISLPMWRQPEQRNNPQNDEQEYAGLSQPQNQSLGPSKVNDIFPQAASGGINQTNLEAVAEDITPLQDRTTIRSLNSEEESVQIMAAENTTEQGFWTCSKCTFAENPAMALACTLCAQEKSTS